MHQNIRACGRGRTGLRDPWRPRRAGRAPGARGAAAGEGTEPPLSEGSEYLQREHKLLSEELDACKQRDDQVKQSNLIISEAARLREENREEENRVDLSQIHRQRRAAELQLEQLARIQALERELLHLCGEHTQLLHNLKRKDNAAFEREARTQRAEREAARTLLKHTQAIRVDNGRLRPESLQLRLRAQVPRNMRRQLLEQAEQLRRELEDTRDLHGWLRRGPSFPSKTPSRASAVLFVPDSQNPSQVLSRADSLALSLPSKVSVPRLPPLVPSHHGSSFPSLAPSRANSLVPSNHPSHAGSRVQSLSVSCPGSMLPSLTPSGPGSEVASFTPSKPHSQLSSPSSLHAASQNTILSGKLVPRSGCYSLPVEADEGSSGDEAASGRA
ncbi:hypothetical protein FD755_006279 [Muntiacus reevesi]|uniref:DUF4515 domain-containing protein n=1 Tax=Muntiacus reevesi TaxID=9886 RepID=A0A5J5MY71_MUNRE|nr:hypothetical protein FD755_006279 [Muntiacus reevesi]